MSLRTAELVERVARLLADAGEEETSTDFARLGRRLREEPKSADAQAAVRDVLALFGGMGSFADFVIYVDGRPDVERNRVLARLRSELFESARDDLA